MQIQARLKYAEVRTDERKATGKATGRRKAGMGAKREWARSGNGKCRGCSHTMPCKETKLRVSECRDELAQSMLSESNFAKGKEM